MTTTHVAKKCVLEEKLEIKLNSQGQKVVCLPTCPDPTNQKWKSAI